MDKQNYYDPEETETYSIKLSQASGEHPEESNGVFDRPACLLYTSPSPRDS